VQAPWQAGAAPCLGTPDTDLGKSGSCCDPSSFWDNPVQKSWTVRLVQPPDVCQRQWVLGKNPAIKPTVTL